MTSLTHEHGAGVTLQVAEDSLAQQVDQSRHDLRVFALDQVE